MHLHLAPDSDHSHSAHGHHSRGLARFLLAAALLAVAAALVWRSVFFVDETEYVYVTQFGEPLRLYTNAGLGVKWPYQSLRRFDRRLQMVEPAAREILTEDKENLNFQWYVCWRLPSREFVLEQREANKETLADGDSPANVDVELEGYVRRFLQAVGTKQAAESRLEERIQSAIAAEIGHTRLEQIVSLDAQQLQLEAIADRVTLSIRDIAAEQFGIEVVDLRLKRFSYPEAVKPAVYAKIRSERERVAIQYRAEGISEKAKIESRADLQRDQLLAQADHEATRIRGQGEAKAIEIANAAHGQNVEFYEQMKTLETYRSILDDQTTIVLSADSPLLRLLTRGLSNSPEETPNETPP